ncbi:unnamed protein product [Cuscuta epithymum]|uniref:Uncharacterized protein n=1 Tax=Cuscuta epithymum TaxID=186058 RepID=A0AAV0F3A0_9ASTE|nr:unnamed protein product [Cuscuta epithymum]
MVGSASRVMMTGGFALFFDPGGRPRGRRTTSMDAPSFPEEDVRAAGAATTKDELGCGEMDCCFFAVVVAVDGVVGLRLSVSSEFWHSRAGAESWKGWWKMA